MALVLVVGCGQVRDLGQNGFQAPPQKLGEVRGQTSLGPAVLSLYSGQVDPERVLGWVGTLDEVIEVTEVVAGSGAVPFEQKSEEVTARNSPIYMLSSTPEKTELAAFVDSAFQAHLSKPLFHSRIIELSPYLRYCEQFSFRGNDYLKDPVKCNPGAWCFVPQPANFLCRLDGQGQPECQPWRRYGMPVPNPIPYSRADYLSTLEEPRAFVCNHWANASPFSYRLREMKRLSKLRASFDIGRKIKIETPSGQLDSGASDTRWVQFREQWVDFLLE